MAQHDAPMSRDEEKALLGRVRAGDAAATRALVNAHKDRLFAFIWRMIRNHHDAEEVCQDAFLKAFASLDSFSTQFRFSTWLFTIAYRVCLNHMRRRKPLSGEIDMDSLEPAGADSPAELALASEHAAELSRQVWSAVNDLSAPQRAAVLLFYRYEQSCQEIAQVLQLPVATVKSHLHRARARLRDTLSESVAAEYAQGRTLRLAGG